MMNEAIGNFAEQLKFKPEIMNPEKLGDYSEYLICGMGGSHLAADLIVSLNPGVKIEVHEDYGIPDIRGRKNLLVILSSYSGNTEEVLDACEKSKAAGLPMAAIAIGGKLIDIAKQEGIPYVVLPDTGIQPRSALGFSFMAMTSLMRLASLSESAEEIGLRFKPADLESLGKALSVDLAGTVPIIYASQKNFALAFNWKIKLNETGKIPAFFNVVPELNHNEMNGFDVNDSTKMLSERFHFVFLIDDDDHPRNKKRMENLEVIFKERHLPVTKVPLQGKSQLEKFFTASVLADWTAYHTALAYGLEPEAVPLVQSFKQSMK